MTAVIVVVALTPAQSIPAGAAGAEEEFQLRRAGLHPGHSRDVRGLYVHATKSRAVTHWGPAPTRPSKCGRHVRRFQLEYTETENDRECKGTTFRRYRHELPAGHSRRVHQPFAQR